MEDKIVIKNSSNQLSFDFEEKAFCNPTEQNLVAENKNLSVAPIKQTIVVDINDYQKITQERNSKQIIEYIIKNSKRF